MTENHKIRIAHVSTFPPQRCGIAEYAADLASALQDVQSLRFGLAKHPPLPQGCVGVAEVHTRANLAKLAQDIHHAHADVVDLQHEFGIWGGDEGEHMLAFLEECRTPIVSTLHTTFPPGINRRQTEILRALVRASSRVIVLTEQAAENTQLLDPQCSAKLRIIRHGVPNISFVPPPVGRPVFVSPGFFRPDKGLETVLAALSMLADDGIDFQHLIIGGMQADNGDQRRYKAHVEILAHKLGISDNVQVIARDFERDSLIENIAQADCAVLGYANAIHASSGIIPLVLATGRPVICAPIEYVRATKDLITGLIPTDGPGSLQLFDQIKKFVSNIELHRRNARRTYEDTRPWVWQKTAEKYRIVFSEALA